MAINDNETEKEPILANQIKMGEFVEAGVWLWDFPEA
jgi:hypothetical protein